MMAAAEDQVPQDLLDRWERERATRERAVRELEAMTPEERLEACQAFVNATLERGDDLVVAYYPPWINNGEGMHGKLNGTLNEDSCAGPEPVLCFRDFSRQELVTILKSLGKVRDWRETLPAPTVTLISSWTGDPDIEDGSYGPIIGKLMKAARLALGMNMEAFYAPAGMTGKTALKWESGDIPEHFQSFGERRFKAISEAHNIPLEWLLCLDRLNADCRRRKAKKEAAHDKPSRRAQSR
jgi:hypothetical protein